MRRTTTVTITAEGRDKGAQFLVTEMDADRAESWAMRALLALTNAGADLPFDLGEVKAASMAKLAAAGIEALTKLQFDTVKPLLDEMMSCVQFIPSSGPPAQPLLKGPACQIQEVSTRLQLRLEVLKLHVDFSTADGSPN